MIEVIKKYMTFLNVFSVISGGFIGYISWSFSTELVLFSSLLFFAYLLFEKRSTLALLFLTYYLVAGRGLLGSVSYYYHSWSLALFFWLLYAFILTLATIGIWSENFWKRVFLFPFMVIILILPPIGYLSAGNPLNAAGIVFPGYGFAGLYLYLIIIVLLSLGVYLCSCKKVGWIGLILLVFIQVERWQPSKIDEEKFKTTINHFHYTPVRMKKKKRRIISKQLLQASNEFNQSKILFYENALSEFSENDIDIWKSLNKDKSVYLGAYIYDTNKLMYDNAVLKITSNQYSVIYKQRIPMPVSMWKPFSNKGAKLNLLKNPIVVDGDERLGFFICYEQMLIFPYLQTMWYNPTALLGLSNLWWSRDNTFLHAQIIMMHAWGSLMGIPVYYSYNNIE